MRSSLRLRKLRGRHIALSTRLLALDDQSITVEFCVTDTGIDIAKGKLKSSSTHSTRLADRQHEYVRIASLPVVDMLKRVVQEYGGAGLGPSISKRLVSLVQGNIWAESEMSKGSRFFFAITSQISPLALNATLSKMVPFANRTILFVDTLFDHCGVVERVKELRLRPYVVHEVNEISDKEKYPHIDTIVVDSNCRTSLFFAIRCSCAV